LISRILIVGLGSAGSRHLRLARLNFPNSEIKVLCHRTQSVIPEFSDGYFLEIENAIQFAPDIAIVANPSTFHIQIANQLALAKTHLLIEKPLSSSVEGVHELIEMCKKDSELSELKQKGYYNVLETIILFVSDEDYPDLTNLIPQEEKKKEEAKRL
jgi:predicted dehydrogenase